MSSEKNTTIPDRSSSVGDTSVVDSSLVDEKISQQTCFDVDLDLDYDSSRLSRNLENENDNENDPDVILKHFLKIGPSAWTPQEERRVTKLTDFRVLAWACCMFFSLELDRANISNVLTTDFLENLGMTTQDYNLGQTLFLVVFLVMEIPSQMIIRYLGPEIWLPVMMVGWGGVAISQAFIKARWSYLLTRVLLGLCEGGFIPGLVLYLSSFYKSHELAIRYSWIWSANIATDIVSALLAVAILQMKNVHGWWDWQWLFFIEGLLTTVIGIMTAFMLPSIRSKHISRVYTAREVAILRAKVIFDDKSKTVSLKRNRYFNFDFKSIFFSLFDLYLFPLYFLGFFGYIPSLQGKQYLTINLKAMNFTGLQSNLLTIPGSVLCIITMQIVSRISDRKQIRWIFPIIASIWVIPCLIALIALPDDASRWVRYACLSLIIGYPYFHPIMIAWVSQNSNNHERRAVAAAWYNIFVQCGKIAGSNIYQIKDKPFYHRGNSALIGIAVANALVAVYTKFLYSFANRRREQKLAAMTPEEVDTYKQETHDRGNQRLDFKLYM
ncbi:major facilitator superfamily domain-containing protein [Lipomyces oligophaga]|uniref:major facilitator superfamily domain-containing protein n=1 Tax=Lipomyces oligophaga TaxID=45792 RepID=UPI0034CD5B69